MQFISRLSLVVILLSAYCAEAVQALKSTYPLEKAFVAWEDSFNTDEQSMWEYEIKSLLEKNSKETIAQALNRVVKREKRSSSLRMICIDLQDASLMSHIYNYLLYTHQVQPTLPAGVFIKDTLSKSSLLIVRLKK